MEQNKDQNKTITFSICRNKNVEFDFMDDVAVPTMRVRKQNTKGPKKKTTNFASVINAMNKNKRSK